MSLNRTVDNWIEGFFFAHGRLFTRMAVYVCESSSRTLEEGLQWCSESTNVGVLNG